MKKTHLLLLFILTQSSFIAAREIKTPQLPRGLSVDKKSAVFPRKQSTPTVRNIKGNRKGLQGYKKHHTFSEMDFDELAAAKETQKKSKNWDIAIKYLERMIKLCDNINTKAALMIELADILFQTDRYDDAAKWYTEFTMLYPGNEQIEYASYRAIICSSKKILSIDRDQAPTEKTLELANEFLKRSELFTKYQTEVRAIQKVCQETLAQSDCNVAQFYLKNGSYKAAQRRLENVRSDWSDKVPEIKIQLAQLETDLAAVYQEFKAPQESVVLAQATKPIVETKKVDMAARF